jgi:SsrA-binding protein
VPPYGAGSYNNVDAKRKRKLLLHKREILRLASKIQRSGATCVPLTLYFKGARVKVEIALVTGKQLHDKRETIRRREADREARTAMKNARRR